MTRIISKDLKVKTKIYKNMTVIDGLIIILALILSLVLLSSSISFRVYLTIFLDVIIISSLIKVNDEKIYEKVFHIIKFFFRKKDGEEFKDKIIKNIDNLILVKVNPIPFNLLSEEDQDRLVIYLSKALKAQMENRWCHLITTNEYVDTSHLISYQEKLKEKLKESLEFNRVTKDEFLSRLSVINNNILYLKSINIEKIKTRSFYFVSLKEDEYFINNLIEVFKENYIYLEKIENNKEKILLNYLSVNKNSFIKERLNYIQIDDKKYSFIYIDKYPIFNENGFLEELMKIDNMSCSLSFTLVNKDKATKRIDDSILEVQSNNEFKASSILDKETYIKSLTSLLSSIQNGVETFHDFTLIIKCLVKDKKEVLKKIKELSFHGVEKIGRVKDLALKSSFLVSLFKEKSSVSCETLVSSFPFSSNDILEKGPLVGVSDNLVSIDFFKRDEEHLNSNMVVIGKSGSGKSFFTKDLLLNLSTTPSKIFILDPEGEYLNLTKSLNGEIIEVLDKEFKVINPFEMFIESYFDFFSHLQFLEEFYRTLFAGIEVEDLEKLNKLTLELYKRFNISKDTDFKKLNHNQFPTFQDLYNLTKEYKEERLINYLSKVSDGGMNSSFLNGITSFNPNKKIIDLSFLKLMQSKNTSLINALMLLILKYLEGEVIKGKENKEKTIIVIDEAHLFIDEKYPIALDFMYEMAKRIRKFNGMQIIITQNIKDFCLSENVKRKSMAIISVSQYSLIFSLSPSDLKDLEELYQIKKLNSKELDYISSSKRGSCFFIKNPNFRTTFKVVAPKNHEEKFK